MRQIVVTGGRSYGDSVMLQAVLGFLAPHEVFVGCCPTGADALAIAWCDQNNVPYRVFEADWDKHGRAAGPLRNKEMIRAAKMNAVVVAFPGGKGTASCIKEAVGLNKIILQVHV